MEWQPYWPKVSPAEYVLTGAAIAGTVSLVLLLDYSDDGYEHGVLYDDAVREQLRGTSREDRNIARTVGDFGYRSMLIFPVADVAISALAVHGNGEVAWQMFSISAEAMALAGLAGIATDHLVGRGRPSNIPCKDNPEYERFCGEVDQFGSFISGHTAIASAGAGVTCAHHLNMPLYGGGAPDVLVCVGASALAITTGVARIINDRHWATDVTFAWGVGAVTGYVWPTLLHYRSAPKSNDESRSRPAFRHAFVPSVAPGAVGLGWYAMF